MQEIEKCPSCGRKVWDGSEAIGPQWCHRQNSYPCTMTKNINNLAATVRQLILGKGTLSKAEVRTALAIVEAAKPSGHCCPTCGQSGVVVKSSVKVHTANIHERRPCPTSFKTVLGGVVLEDLP